MMPLPLSLLLRAWLLSAVVDGLFSSVLSAVFYGSTVARLWDCALNASRNSRSAASKLSQFR